MSFANVSLHFKLHIRSNLSQLLQGQGAEGVSMAVPTACCSLRGVARFRRSWAECTAGHMLNSPCGIVWTVPFVWTWALVGFMLKLMDAPL